MTIAMQPIYTQTVGSGGAATVTFNNIPQTFTDLAVQISSRSTSGYGAGNPSLAMKFIYNGDTSETLYSSTYELSTGSGRYSGAAWAGWMNSSNSTATTFGSLMGYLPNYTSANFKSVLTDNAVEDNGTTGLYYGIQAQLYRSTSAITSVKFVPELGNFAQYSTFTLYGITKG